MAEQFTFQLDRPTVAPKPAVKKPRYSYSALEQAKCGERYRQSKLTKARELTYNLAAGTMLDTAFNAYYENNQHLSQTHDERMEYARAALTLHLQEHPEYFTMPWSAKAGDPRSSPENFIAWLFDCGSLALVCRHDRGPVEVQKKVELELPDYSIVGYIDCLEINTGTVVDVKAVTGWSKTTQLSYALRAQVPLYRMILNDTLRSMTKGRYELLLCRKKPSLVTVEDRDIEFLQSKLIKDFDEHHRKLSTKTFEKNPEQCFAWNKPCEFFGKCWPMLAGMVEQPETT